MIPIPTISNLDIAFGNIQHMPKYEDVPDEFKDWNNEYCKFVSKWFYAGITKEDAACLTPKEDVQRGAAIAAIKAILVSFDPKHEHKIAGAAYLLSQWFDLKKGVLQ